MTTKRLYLLVLLFSLLTVPLTTAFHPAQTVDPCEASKKVDLFLSKVRWAKIDDRLPKYVLSWIAGFDLFVGPEGVSQEMEAWFLKYKELGISNRSELIQTLENAGWKRTGTYWEGGDFWNKPKDWQDPCSGGGSGGAAAQFSFNHILWLIIFAILALLAIGLLKRRFQTAEI